MRRVLLVTAREYRRTIALPAFWVISLLIPLIVAAAPVAANLFSRSQTVGYVLVDKSGRYAAPINQRVDLDFQRQVLINLLLYAQQWRASSATTASERAVQAESSLSDAAVANFVAAGGAPAVLRLLKPTLLPSAPAFYPPQRSFVELPLPEGVATDSADRFGASIGPHFQQSSRTPSGEAALHVAIYIPENVDSGGQVRVWTSGEAGTRLVQDLRLELTQRLRLEGLRAAGVDPLSAAQIESLSAPVSIAPAQTSAGGSHAVIHSPLPLALAELLLVSMVITGSMMLQGLVEERSNKLLETVLACVSAGELLGGKLLGISAIGLSIVGIWVSAAIGILYTEPSSPLGFLVPAFASLSQTPGIAAAMIFYFLAGYLTIGMIFLAVGAVSDSMQDAQGYLMPLGLLIAVPAVGLANLIYRDPNGLVAQIFSWIPLYTPVTMLARLQHGVSAFEIFGTITVLLGFAAVELLLLGHLFENKLIQTGQGFRVAPKTRRTALRMAALFPIIATVAVIVHHNRTFAPPQHADQTIALHTRGETVFKTACASCHEPAVGRAPSREQLASFAPDRVVAALTSGVMKPMAVSLSGADMRAVATYLTGQQPVGSSTAAADPPECPKPTTFTMQGSEWNGWSIDPRNWRFQPDPGLSASDVPRLNVKWAFSYVGGKYGQPTVVGGRLFLTSMSGAVYSLDAKTGCMFWRFNESVPSRTTVSVGPAPGVAPSGYAAYFGDLSANMYAVDAANGALLWKTRVDPHPRSVLTGAPTLFKDRLYVPVSSWEEAVASVAHYSCCTFRGGVAALDAATGRIVWTAFAIEQAPTPTRRNSAGTQMYGPAGAAVWSAPTIDARRNRIYFATGNSYTDAVEGGSDAVIAVDLASGAIIWRRQLIQGDNDLSGCSPGKQLVNCPTTLGHDYDFGASPVLLPLATGKDVLLAGQKSGAVFGIEPDTGNVLWRTQVGVGGFLGGIEWGMASDGARLYVANADVFAAENGRPGLFALDPTTGKDLWYTPSPRVGCHWHSWIPCFDAQSAAPSAVPGVIFAGSTDGHERAYASADGNVLWDFDTAGRTYRTINGVNDQTGGPIDVSSGTIADGMLFLISGYLGVAGGGSDNVLLAFSVDGR
ncbi:MAG TPA: PQQ-binding-like beta-propeller repeat protein [Xanthobacteraceae bacterium]